DEAFRFPRHRPGVGRPSAQPSAARRLTGMTPAPAAGPLMARLLRTRWLMRLPIGLFRRGLGWMLGPRLLMIEHLGRRSGAPRYVVVEVLERGPGRFVVASGFGPGAQWYQNLRANRVAYLSTGLLRRAAARPRFLRSEERRVGKEGRC